MNTTSAANTLLSAACLASPRSLATRRKHVRSIAAIVQAGEGHLFLGDGPLPMEQIKNAFMAVENQARIERYGELGCWWHERLEKNMVAFCRFLQRNREWAADTARLFIPFVPVQS